MVQRLVLKNQSMCIYQIEESDLKFYMMIPNCLEVSLGLGLMSLVNDTEVQKIKQEKNQVIVVPVLAKDLLVGISQGQEKSFEIADQYFSKLINLSYKILVHNHIQVANVVYFSTKGYDEFQNWFVNKYQGRVQPFSLQFQEAPVVQDNVGKEEVIEHTMTLGNVPLEEEVKKEVQPSSRKEPGFVSYVLLGVVVAVISLVFLYLII